MTLIHALTLGILQGLTEFLPVSSSGHLVIIQKLFVFQEPPVIFDILVHLATMLAVVIYFRRQLFSLDASIIKALIIGTIPAVIVGYFLNAHLELIFNSLALVAITLVINSILLFSTYKKTARRKNDQVNLPQAFLIGWFQALAILPGISRSGSTITAGIWSGLSLASAFTFSFLLSIPSILGAVTLQLPQLIHLAPLDTLPLFLGMFTAFISGLFALSVLKKAILNHRFFLFGFYTLFLAFLTFTFLQAT